MSNIYKIVVLIVCSGIFLSSVALCQDAQLSQFFAAPIYTNPALAGSTGGTRYGLNYRRQWPSIPGGFSTYMFSYDSYVPAINSGVSLFVFKDIAKNSRLSTNFINATYAYGVRIAEHAQIRFAVSAQATFLGLDKSKLVFKDQILNQTASSTIENSITETKTYIDYSFASLVSIRRFWTGLTIDHLLRPDQSLLSIGSRLPQKYTVYGGIKYKTNYKTDDGYSESSIFSLMYLYKHQGKFDQLDMGVSYQDIGFILGCFYRGIPLLKTNADHSINNDAIAFLIGYKTGMIYWGYTYDLTVSKLRDNTGGSHEIAMQYILKSRLMPKRITNSPHPPKCPEFN